MSSSYSTLRSGVRVRCRVCECVPPAVPSYAVITFRRLQPTRYDCLDPGENDHRDYRATNLIEHNESISLSTDLERTSKEEPALTRLEDNMFESKR